MIATGNSAVQLLHGGGNGSSCGWVAVGVIITLLIVLHKIGAKQRMLQAY